MASFERVGKRWKAVVRKKGFPKRTKTFDTKKEANAWAVEYESSLLINHSDPIPSEITLGVLIRRYLAEETIHKKSARVESLILNRFLRDFPHTVNKPVNEVTPLDIANWKEAREKLVKGSTVRREWSSLSSVFSHATKSWGLPIKENPFTLVNKPKQEKPRNQRISNSDIEEFLSVLDYKEKGIVQSSKQKAAWCFLFAIETAMRAGEILKLRDSDINGRIALLRDTKNGDDRRVPLSREAMKLIEFLPEGFPVGITSAVLDATFRKHRPEELKHITFHDSRHEALSRMAKKIPNPMDLAKISGHRDLRVLLNTYYNPDDDHLVSLLD